MSKVKILGLVRHILTTIGGSGFAVGVATEDEITLIVSGVIALVGVIWSWVSPEKQE